MSPQLTPAQVADRLFTTAKPKLRAWMSRNADRIETAFTAWGAGLADGFQDPYFGHVRVRYFTPATGRQIVLTWEKLGVPQVARYDVVDGRWAPEGTLTAAGLLVTVGDPVSFLLARVHHIYGEKELPVPSGVDPNDAADWLPKSYWANVANMADIAELVGLDPRRRDDPYGSFLRALSAYIKARTRVDIPPTYWAESWHWPLANFADMRGVTAQQVYASLSGVAKSRAATEENNAASSPLEVRELDRVLDMKPEIKAQTVAEWSQGVRGASTAEKTKLGSPTYVGMVQDRGPAALQKMISSERQSWAQRVTTAANHADEGIRKAKKAIQALGRDRDYLRAFGDAQGEKSPSAVEAFERAIQKKAAQIHEDEALVTRARREVERQTLDATMHNAIERFLAGENWGYVGRENKAEAEAVVRALKAPPPERARKPIAYVYAVKGATMIVWPVLSVADARALFEQVKHEHKEADGVQVRKSLEAEIAITRENYPNVTTVDIRPVWTTGDSVDSPRATSHTPKAKAPKKPQHHPAYKGSEYMDYRWWVRHYAPASVRAEILAEDPHFLDVEEEPKKPEPPMPAWVTPPPTTDEDRRQMAEDERAYGRAMRREARMERKK